MKLHKVQLLQKSTIEKLPQRDYNRLYNLYQEKKSQITLDGKQATIIKLTSKFPIIFISKTQHEVEFSAKTIERILNSTCAFKS